SRRTSGTVACRLEPSLAGGRSGEELIQQLLEGLFARPSGRRRSVEIDRRLLDGVDISGPVNLPPPCLWRRCPVLHHDRIVSALIITVCSLENYVLDVDRFLGRISPVCGALPVECHKPGQSPAPGFGEKYWSLSGFPSHSLESGGGAFLTVIFGQILAYCAFSDSHFSSPGSLSALIASTRHSGSHTQQSMHSSGWL